MYACMYNVCMYVCMCIAIYLYIYKIIPTTNINAFFRSLLTGVHEE